MTSALQPKWSSIYPQVISATCAGAACHIGGSAGGLNLGADASSAYAALVGQGPGPSTLSCTGAPNYVVPNDPNNSLLVWKVEGHDASGSPVCGTIMPLGLMLTSDQITAIRDWISMGAMND